MDTHRSAVQKRLAGAAACLEHLDQSRGMCGDPTLGKAIEEGIISRELLDLELQEFDEELERICDVTEDLLADAEADNA